MRAFVRRTRWSDILTFALFVVFATVLWFGHALESVRNAVVPMCVVYTGVPENVAFDNELPDTIMVEVRDAGRRLRDYYTSPLSLTIDLKGQIQGTGGTVRVSSDVLRRSVSDLLQGTSKLIAVTPESVVGTYFRQDSKVVPVVLTGIQTPAPEYQIAVAPIIRPTEVTIYGKSAQLDTMKCIKTEPVEAVDLHDTTTCTATLHLPKGIRASKESVSVTWIAERYTEKKVIVPLNVIGVPAGEHIRLFPNVIEVTMRVGMSHFDDVSARDVRACCAYPTANADKLDVDVVYSNPLITSVRAYPNEVEFIIEKH